MGNGAWHGEPYYLLRGLEQGAPKCLKLLPGEWWRHLVHHLEVFSRKLNSCSLEQGKSIINCLKKQIFTSELISPHRSAIPLEQNQKPNAPHGVDVPGNKRPMTSTCLRIMSMVCMMQRGRRPWFLAKIIACSRVTFRVHLQRTKKAKGECCADNVRARNPDTDV